ncbi:MAG: hypothetical protein CL763_00740 [Chloroflexi bacterium]|nr:hypothetical protein [Chloroflexota bacterium]|tara:strand:+ start:4503 stop:5372 length:870 start_codon:yes stop_codon:yes gene_type:complete
MSIKNNPRVYAAAGATIIAAAVATRYVAKWRKRRYMRRGSGTREVGGGQVFIGLDLTDPYAINSRPCDYAVLDTDLKCSFGIWNYQEDGTSIIPEMALGRSFILAIDGPQGLAGEPEATVRNSEALVNAPGRTPYDLKLEGKPYQGLIKGSVNLFYKLVTSGSRFRLLGLDGIPLSDTTLIEVYPGGVWKLISSESLPSKRTLSGRYLRAELLTQLGIKFPTSDLPTDDQLDAALAAWIAHKFWLGESSIEGMAPELDEKALTIREGYIVMPKYTLSSENSESEEFSPV